MKKLLFLLAIIFVALSVSACTTKPSPSGEEAVTPSSPTQDEDNNLADDQTATAPTTPIADQNATVTPVQSTTTMQAPDQQTNLLKDYSQVIIKTSLGNITVKLYATAPLAANNFLNLAKAGFYDNTKFHRIIKDFMIQGGDPNSKGSDALIYGQGGPGYQFKNEDSGHKLVAGSLAMANAGPDTNGSQFFIVTADSTPWLDGSYTNFGEVVSGMDIVRKIENSPVKTSPSGENSMPVNYVTVTGVELVK